MQMPIDRLLNLVYFYVIQAAEEKDRIKFDTYLHRPPAGAPRQAAAVSDASPWSKQNEENALGSLAAALGGGGA